MPHHPLTNFEIQKYYQYGPKFYGVSSRNNFAKIKYSVICGKYRKFEKSKTS